MSKLKIIREKNGMTKQCVAEKLGISMEEYDILEKSPLKVTPSTAKKIINLFNLPATKIFLP